MSNPSTQQYDALALLDGSDLASKVGWTTRGALTGAAATTGPNATGLFTFANTAAWSASNQIAGLYTKPANAAARTGKDIPRAWFNAAAGNILPETTCTVRARFRVSSNKTGAPLKGWPTSTQDGQDMDFGVIARANGTDYTASKWFELGVNNLDTPGSGSLIIRKVVANVTTTLGTATFASINPAWKFPSYQDPGFLPQDEYLTIAGVLVNVGADVFLGVQVTRADGLQIQMIALDAASVLTAAGYGGFYATGNADAAGSLWVHASEFLLTAGDATYELKNPPDANVPPTLTAEPVLTSIAIAKESDSGTVDGTATLPKQPDFSISEDVSFDAIEQATDAGYVGTIARFTGTRRLWTLDWGARNDADTNIMIAFFESRTGAARDVYWTTPRGANVRMMYVDSAQQTGAKDVGVSFLRARFLEILPT